MVTVKVSELVREGKEEISMEDLERLCKDTDKLNNVNYNKEDSCKNNCDCKSTTAVIKADNTILLYLYLIYSDMSREGIKGMYYSAKAFVNEKTGLTGVELSKATSLTMIDLLDYTRDLINMNNEMEEE
jgi:hypothetical protein